MSKNIQNKRKVSNSIAKMTGGLPKHLEHINLCAAGIDVGATSHFVAVPEGSDETTVREFKSFTTDLNALADWLKKCGVKTIAMESTGVYWIPIYELLEDRGFDVKLVDARQVKNVSGRKTTGMNIIRAIVAGERDPERLAQNRDRRCKNPLSVIEQALMGHYREEHLFALQQALELYDIYQQKIANCDSVIEKKLSEFTANPIYTEHPDTILESKKKPSKNAPAFDMEGQLLRLTGVNLIEIPGINSLTALSIVGEIGLDMTRWGSAKQFASWLGLCPGNKVSGGKRLSGRSKPSANRAAAALRLAASSLYRSPTALGAYLRRLKARLGPAKAITATAHKLAKIIYNMLHHGVGYKEAGQEYYEQQYRDRVIKGLQRKAESYGFALVEKVSVMA